MRPFLLAPRLLCPFSCAYRFFVRSPTSAPPLNGVLALVVVGAPRPLIWDLTLFPACFGGLARAFPPGYLYLEYQTLPSILQDLAGTSSSSSFCTHSEICFKPNLSLIDGRVCNCILSFFALMHTCAGCSTDPLAGKYILFLYF